MGQHYPKEIKLEAIRLFYEEGKSRAEITALLQIRDADRVKKWLRSYRRGGEAAFEKKKRTGLIGRPPKKRTRKLYIARLEMENALLKNSMPNCASWSSRSAISDHRTIPKNLSREGDVSFLWDFASGFLCLVETNGDSRSR